jgi:signal transduction histidine kinase/AmiR/NasT family two-component response regulator
MSDRAARPPVLVVEDESIVAMDLSTCLTKLGYPIAAVVGRGEEAIELARRHRPGLVLMDIHLRGQLDGIEAAQRIHGDFHIPVVFLTAYSDDATLQRAQGSQPFGYLIKPFQDREVEVAAQTALHRHALETSLRESRGQLDAILGSIGDAVVASDGEGVVVFINRAAEALLGVDTASARGRKVVDLVRTFTAPDGTVELERPAGPVPVEVFVTQLPDVDARTAWSVTVLRDISERRRAEAARERILREHAGRVAVEQEHERARLQLDVSVILSQSFDDSTDKPFQAVADRLVPTIADHCLIESLTEDGTRACIGEAGERPPPPDDPTLELTLARPMVARGRVLGRITLNRRPRGRVFDEVEAGFLNELAMRSGLALDNRLLYRAAQLAIQARDDFLSVASHELKTPLTSMILSLDGLERALGKTTVEGVAARLESKLSLVIGQSERLSRLVDELLDSSRLVAGRLHLNLEPVDLGRVVREVIAEIQGREDSGAAPVDVDIQGTIIGHWDRIRIGQIVYNLLSNALKYGQGNPIDIRADAQEQTAVLAVTDRGIGIALEDQERIFARFERAVTPGHIGGLGLGLFITRQLVEALAGTVAVTSRKGAGSTFTVRLPLAGPGR